MATSRRAVIIAVGAGQTLGWGSTYYLPAILAGPMAAEIGVTTGLVYGAFSAALILSALLGPIVGRRIDKLGGRDLLWAANLVFAVGLGMLGLAENTLGLFVAWLVIGVGMSMGLYDAAFATLAGLYGRDARGAITGITLMAGFASTICWPVTAVMEAEIGWRAACFAWAAAHLVIGLPLNRLFVPKGNGAPAGGETAGETHQSAGPGEPPKFAAAILALVFAITWFTSTAMAAHLPRILQEAGTSPAAAIAAAALVGPAQVAGRLLEFGFLKNFHPLLSARLAALTHPLGAAVILAVGAPAASAFSLLHGAGNGILTITNGTLPLAIFGAVGYGRRQGLLMAPARFVQAGAPFLFALAIDHLGAAALMLSGGLGLISFAALMMLRAR
ncbi:MAG TPA: MFS transporter [Rhodospirillaceae bacterium]|nr:MFS transporter [Rhodospirillaceae bacterium]